MENVTKMYHVCRAYNSWSTKGDLLEQYCRVIESFSTPEAAQAFYDTVDLPADEIAHQTCEPISKVITETDEF